MSSVLITGAASGIGLATARKFLAEGYTVLGTYHHLKPEIIADNFIAVPLDLNSEESITSAAEAVKKAVPHLDVLVNAAGVLLEANDAQVDLNKIRQTFEVNVFGLISLTEKLLPLLEPGSQIINIDSEYGSFSFSLDDATAVGYRLSKAALNMYTRVLALRLQEQKIIVSSLDPGWVKTKMGYLAADETAGPDREPAEAAKDIYNLVNNQVESGHFWRQGKIREW